MKVLDLRCAHGHRFEGWFASDADMQSQMDRGLLTIVLPLARRAPKSATVSIEVRRST